MDTRRIVKFLKTYGQQQSFEVIRDRMKADFDDDVDREDIAKLVESGKIVEVDGGVDGRGQPQTHYVAADDED